MRFVISTSPHNTGAHIHFGFQDHFDSNIRAAQTIRAAKTIFKQGERHLVELECPDRIVSETCNFVSESKQAY